MQRRRDAGSGIWAVLVLLLVLAGAGAWNYQRNLAVEEAVYRPFRTHTDEDLAQLAGAREPRRTGLEALRQCGRATCNDPRTRPLRSARAGVRARAGAGDAKKALRAELAKSTTTLKLLAEEERMRAGERDAVKLFFKRLLTI